LGKQAGGGLRPLSEAQKRAVLETLAETSPILRGKPLTECPECGAPLDYQERIKALEAEVAKLKSNNQTEIKESKRGGARPGAGRPKKQ